MGEHGLMSLPFICAALTRLGAFRPPRFSRAVSSLIIPCKAGNLVLIIIYTDLATQAFFCERRSFPLGSCSSACSAALCSPPHRYCPLQRPPTTSSPAAICSPACFNSPSCALAQHASDGWASHQDRARIQRPTRNAAHDHTHAPAWSQPPVGSRPCCKCASPEIRRRSR